VHNDPEDLHPFQKLFGPLKNPYLVTTFAEKKGMGSTAYTLVEVLPAHETANMEVSGPAFERSPSFY
jgi:hypothetical protein